MAIIDHGGCESKKCSGCKLIRPVSEFYIDLTRSDGLSYLCKDCERRRKAKEYQGCKEV